MLRWKNFPFFKRRPYNKYSLPLLAKASESDEIKMKIGRFLIVNDTFDFSEFRMTFFYRRQWQNKLTELRLQGTWIDTCSFKCSLRFWGHQLLVLMSFLLLSFYKCMEFLSDPKHLNNMKRKVSPYNSSLFSADLIFIPKKLRRNLMKSGSGLIQVGKTKHQHGVWKSQKRSHSRSRAKRATFTFWADISLLKMPFMWIWHTYKSRKQWWWNCTWPH